MDPEWLKFKCSRRQELVIGGFTDPGGSRIGFGALLVGHYERQRLVRRKGRHRLRPQDSGGICAQAWTV
ncbi:hypothetical protein [Streptomyces diastatochromogenes]